MCDCIKRIEKEILEKREEYKGRKLLKAKLQHTTFPMSGLKIMGRITTQPLELELEGRKTPLKTDISHTYCPWCGEKYLKEESQSKESKS